MSAPLATPDVDTSNATEVSPDTPYLVMLFNDPINLVGVVTHVLRKVLKVTKDRAEFLMLKAHTDGKVGVFDGTLAECENIAVALGVYGLVARVEKSGGAS